MTTRKKRQPIQMFGLGQSCCDWHVSTETEFVGFFDYSDENAEFLHELRFSGTRRLVFDKIMGHETDVPEPAFDTFSTEEAVDVREIKTQGVPRVINRENVSEYKIVSSSSDSDASYWKLWGSTNSLYAGENRICVFLLGERTENGSYTNDYIEKFGRYFYNSQDDLLISLPFTNWKAYAYEFESEPSSILKTLDESAGTASEVYVNNPIMFDGPYYVNYRIGLVYEVESQYGNGSFKDRSNYGTTISAINKDMYWNRVDGYYFSIVDSLSSETTVEIPDSIEDTTIGGVTLSFPTSATANVEIVHATPTILYGYRNGFVLDGGKTATTLRISFGVRLASSLSRRQWASVKSAEEARTSLANSVAPFFKDAAAEIASGYSNKLQFKSFRTVQFF